MGVEVLHNAEKAELVLVISGNLDLSIAFRLLETRKYVDERLQTCIIDATQVSQVFDSGIEMILLIFQRLKKYQVQLVVLGKISALFMRGMHIDNIRRTEDSYLEAPETATAGKLQTHADNAWKINPSSTFRNRFSGDRQSYDSIH